MIVTQNLNKSFRTIQAVKNVSLEAHDGCITGLLGPNGAGKSTTLRMLATVINPDSGSASIDGIDIKQNSLQARQHMGVLPHNAGLYPRLTARENIAYYGELYGMPKSTIKSRVDELTELLEMQSFIDRKTDGFSQGQRTKVGLARALVHKPQNLLLDEPANGLDVMATRNLRNLIKTLKQQGHCILVSSHIMQEVSMLCDRIIIISNGELTLQGTMDEILQLTGETELEDAFVTAISRQ